MKRKVDVRKQKYDKCLILTNGHTETMYLQTLIDKYSCCVDTKYNGATVECYIYTNNGIEKVNNENIFVDVCHMNANPLQLVTKAIELKKELEDNPSINTNIWCVFDKDDFDKGTNPFDNALKIANEYSINCAYSNRQIEVWFLLHLEKFKRKYNAKDLINRLNLLLEDEVHEEYRKGKMDYYEKVFIPRTQIAIVNARDQYDCFKSSMANQPFSKWISSTNMFKLLEDLGIE